MARLRSPHGLLVLLGYGLGAAALTAGLPTEIPPSWSTARGLVWLGGPLVAFLLPTAAGVSYALLRRLYTPDQGDPSDSDAAVVAAYDAIMLRMMAFVIAVHAMVLGGLLGLLWGRPWAARVVPTLLGLTMIAVGNLLPRTRPNLAIGIRTAGTLSDRAQWVTTHRRAGYLLVASGGAVLLAALAVPAPVGPGMIFAVGPAVVVGLGALMVGSRRSLVRRA